MPVYPDESGFEDGLARKPVSRQPQAPPPLAARPETGPETLYAGFGVRVGAAFIDAMVEGSIQSLLALGVIWLARLVLFLKGVESSEQAFDNAEELALWIFGFAVSAVNQWIVQGLTGASVGKHALGLRVREIGSGQRLPPGHETLVPLGFGTAFLRYALRWVSVMTLGIGFLAVLWTRRRQTLHDWGARTVVVRLGPPAVPKT